MEIWKWVDLECFIEGIWAEIKDKSGPGIDSHAAAEGDHFFISLNPSTFAARPGGEIGRRTVFRSQRGKPCAGSNPVPGTLLYYLVSKQKVLIGLEAAGHWFESNPVHRA